jgi:predicted metal-dependent hydrolase
MILGLVIFCIVMSIEVVYKKGVRHGYARVKYDGHVVMTVPYRLRHDQRFYADLYAKAQKLEKKIATKSVWKPITDEQVRIFGDLINRSHLPNDLDTYLSELLSDYIVPLCELYANIIGQQYAGIAIKKLRSKWGSCSWNQKLVFNRALVHLPLIVVRYVVVHEVAHLIYKHHQQRFW